MLSKGYSYYPHHGPVGMARRWPRPDSARLWPNPAVSLFFLFRAFSPPAPRGLLPGRITMPLNQDGRHTVTMPFNLKRGVEAGLRHWRHNPMLRSGNRVSAYSAWFMLFALCVLTSCNLSNQPKLPKPRFETPVNLSREGVVADFDIRVTWHDIYHFQIYFGFPAGEQDERERVRKIVGGLHEATLVSTPVKLTILKKQTQNEQIVYQKIIEDLEGNGFSSSEFIKTIGHCDLKRGKYRFVLESLAQPQEYASIPTTFVITFDGFPKAIFIPINIDRSKTCPQ